MPTRQARIRRRLNLVGYLILSTAVVLAFWRVDQIRSEAITHVNEVNASQCASLRNLYNVIRKSLEDSDKAIDEIAYYKQNPVERARAHERNRATIAAFRLPPCPPAIRIKE